MDAIEGARAVIADRLAEIEEEIAAIYAPAAPLEAEALRLRAALRGLDAATGATNGRSQPRTGVQAAPTPCPHCGQSFRGQGGMLVHVKKCPSRPVAKVPDPPPARLGPPATGLSSEPLPGGRQLACECGARFAGVADLFAHCRDVHDRPPSKAERVPVSEES